MNIKNIIRDGKEKPVGIVVVSIILVFFGLFCITASISFLALALGIISPIEGVISITDDNNTLAFMGVAYFGIFGWIQIYLGRGLWKLKKSTKDITTFFMVLALISPILNLIGKYTEFYISIVILPRYSDNNLLIAIAVPLLIIFILYFETYKGTFQTE